jgi:cell division septation protein DedD
LKRLKVYESKVPSEQTIIALRQEKPLDAKPEPGDKIGQNTLQQPAAETAKETNQKVYPYIIQISAYREKETSAREALKYKNKGYPVFNSYAYIPRNQGEEWYRIFFGFYESLEKARKAALELKRKKFHYANVLKKPYAVEVGSFTSEQELKKVEADLLQNNYIACRIPVWKEEGEIRLLVGAFKTKKAAARQAAILQEIGLKPRVVQR